MEALRWDSRPELHEPIMLVAFEGWTDGGGAASAAASYLGDHWSALPFAEIDPEEFYDFTVARPHVKLDDSGVRQIVWPANRFSSASVPSGRDVVLMIGIEPHTRWKAFSECVTAVAKHARVQAVFTLGAMLAGVPHTRPVVVRGSSADPRLAASLGLSRPQYQGPTGMVGVLQVAFAGIGVPVGSLMAQVPHYVPGTASPKATLALVERVGQMLSTEVPTDVLRQAAATYEAQVSEAIGSDDEMVEYVRQLEHRVDEAVPTPDEADLPSGDALAAELERFLREQDGP